jgi:uncharacterized membrane protein YeaQ/YmgE (transglycosylase-associated protein family)
MKVSRITKVAGAGLVGFVAVAFTADKVNAAPVLSQMAGFVGAFLGSVIAGRRVTTARKSRRPEALSSSALPVEQSESDS